MYPLKGRARVPVGPVILESSALRAHTRLLVMYVVRVPLDSTAMDKHARQGQQTVSCFSLYEHYYYEQHYFRGTRIHSFCVFVDSSSGSTF